MELDSEKPAPESVPELPASNFESIVASSKEKIAQEAAEQVKRGRGRPPGSTKKPPGDEKSAGPQSSKPGGEKTSREGAASVRNLTEEMKPILKETVKVPFSMAAAHFQEPDFEIADKEAETSSFYLAKYIQLSMPDLENQDPKFFNLAAFILSMILLGLKKLPLFVKLKKSKNPPPEEPHTSAPPEASKEVIEPTWRDLSQHRSGF